MLQAGKLSVGGPSCSPPSPGVDGPDSALRKACGSLMSSYPRLSPRSVCVSRHRTQLSRPHKPAQACRAPWKAPCGHTDMTDIEAHMPWHRRRGDGHCLGQMVVSSAGSSASSCVAGEPPRCLPGANRTQDKEVDMEQMSTDGQHQTGPPCSLSYSPCQAWEDPLWWGWHRAGRARQLHGDSTDGPWTRRLEGTGLYSQESVLGIGAITWSGVTLGPAGFSQLVAGPWWVGAQSMQGPQEDLHVCSHLSFLKIVFSKNLKHLACEVSKR